MEIPKKILDRWRALRSPEDSAKLSEINDSYPEMFNLAFRKGKCNQRVFEAMAKYYAEKAALIKQYL